MIQKDKVEQYLEKNARSIDLALYNFHFRRGDALAVLDEVSKYQNEDGGFGKAIEPDLRLPQSTALATWMGFQFIKEVDVDLEHQVIGRALKYLVNTYDKERNGWSIVIPEVDSYSHAPWWNYQAAMRHFSWGNPSAEIFGLLMFYKVEGVDGLIGSLKEEALKQIKVVNSKNFHEVFNFKALYELADEAFKKDLKESVAGLVEQAANTNPDEWSGYVATPLKFITSPNDPFIELFNESLIQKNLDFIIDKCVNDDHWEPNWDWSGKYPEDWERAKVEWSGFLTVRNMMTLKNFGKI